MNKKSMTLKNFFPKQALKSSTNTKKRAVPASLVLAYRSFPLCQARHNDEVDLTQFPMAQKNAPYRDRVGRISELFQLSARNSTNVS